MYSVTHLALSEDAASAALHGQFEALKSSGFTYFKVLGPCAKVSSLFGGLGTICTTDAVLIWILKSSDVDPLLLFARSRHQPFPFFICIHIFYQIMSGGQMLFSLVIFKLPCVFISCPVINTSDFLQFLPLKTQLL